MSLAIELDDVASVLLGDRWHDVADQSFDLDSYEYVNGTDSRGNLLVIHGGGNAGITSTGFRFKRPDGAVLYGPLTAIQAVRTA